MEEAMAEGDWAAIVAAHPGAALELGKRGFSQRSVDYFDMLSGGERLPCPFCERDHRADR